MALTRDFRETIGERAGRDPEFRVALLTEALNLLFDGDIATGRNILATYINGTLGYQSLGEKLGTHPKSLMRMLGPKGNPRANNLFAIIRELQLHEGVRFDVTPVRE